MIVGHTGIFCLKINQNCSKKENVMKRITKRLIERRCPICGTTTFMVVDEQRYHLIMEHIYAQDNHLNRKLIQEALPFLEPFARELVKTGYCQKCQEILLHSKLKEEEKENYFTVDDVAGKKMDDFIEYKYTYGVHDIQGKVHKVTVLSQEQEGSEIRIDSPKAVYSTKAFYHFGSYLDKVTSERSYPDYWSGLKSGYPANEVCYCRADHNGYRWYNTWFRIYGTKLDTKELDAVFNEVYDNITNLHMLRLYVETHCKPVKKDAPADRMNEWNGFLSGADFDYYFRFSLMKGESSGSD